MGRRSTSDRVGRPASFRIADVSRVEETDDNICRGDRFPYCRALIRGRSCENVYFIYDIPLNNLVIKHKPVSYDKNF